MPQGNCSWKAPRTWCNNREQIHLLACCISGILFISASFSSAARSFPHPLCCRDTWCFGIFGPHWKKSCLSHTSNTLWHVVTQKSHSVLSTFTILCWASFIAILSCMWPTGHKLDTPAYGMFSLFHTFCLFFSVLFDLDLACDSLRIFLQYMFSFSFNSFSYVPNSQYGFWPCVSKFHLPAHLTSFSPERVLVILGSEGSLYVGVRKAKWPKPDCPPLLPVSWWHV